MTNLSAFNGRLAGRVVAAASVIVLASLSVGACAQTLGIEDTTLAPDPSACFEEVVPYLWFFVNDIREDGEYPLAVIPQSAFTSLRDAFGVKADPTRGHVVADARTCEKSTGVRDGGPGDAGGVTFALRVGSETLPSNFFINNDGRPDRDLKTTQTIVSLGGLLNAPAEQGTLTAFPADLEGSPSSSKTILVRPGYLTTLRMEPSAGVPTPEVSPVPGRWSCVGSVLPPKPTSKTKFRITAKITDFSTGLRAAPAPDIRIRVCDPTSFGCDLADNETPDTVSGADGIAEIDVENDGSGAWRGFLVVKGKVRKTTPKCRL